MKSPTFWWTFAKRVRSVAIIPPVFQRRVVKFKKPFDQFIWGSLKLCTEILKEWLPICNSKHLIYILPLGETFKSTVSFFIFFWGGFCGMQCRCRCRFICIVILHHVYFREIILKIKLMFMSKFEMAFSSEALLVWEKNNLFT